MTKVFKCDLSVYLTLTDYSPDEGPLGHKEKRFIEQRVIRLLEHEFPDTDCEIMVIRVEEEKE